MKRKVAIVGAGPAGIAAAIQLQRSGITPLVFEQMRIGGLLNNAFCVENYPGFHNGISGPKLVAEFRKHLRKWKIDVLNERVTSVEKKGRSFLVIAGKQYRADIVIIASGTMPRYGQALLGAPHKKVVFDVYPIRNVKKKKIVIIGAGDAAYDYALNLCRYNEVLILNRNVKKRGLELLIKRAKQADNITYIQNVRIREITQTGEQLIAIVSHNAKRYSISADYIIYAIGRQPAIDFLSSSVKQKFPRGGKNLFFIGDVKQGELRQTAIAIGDGIKVAMEIAGQERKE